jgi:NAD kinase
MKSHSDFNIKVIKEVEVTRALTEGQDLCLTIGGDNTFLKAAGTIINSDKTAILGVNSQPSVNAKLSDMNIDLEKHREQIKMVVEYLQKVGSDQESTYIDYQMRQRIHLEMLRYHGQCSITGIRSEQKSFSEQAPLPGYPLPAGNCWEVDPAENFVVLNEVMVCEKDASHVSMYRLNVDNRDLGKFKSSGIIIATGTGSTGWLYSAKQITPYQVNHFKRVIGSS